jgi:hypothetical protein
MSKAIIAGAALLFFALIVIGLWDLLHGAKPLVAAIALTFVVAGISTPWPRSITEVETEYLSNRARYSSLAGFRSDLDFVNGPQVSP